MFGFIQPDISGLTKQDLDRYQSFYCGLCHSLKRYGDLKRLTLTYDMTFLCVFLSSMYDTVNSVYKKPCIRHPFESKPYFSNEYIDYARDMTIALVYFKCIDDYKDDNNLGALIMSKTLLSAYNKVSKKWPIQCNTIEKELSIISKAENSNCSDADICANSFGRIMISLFCIKEDIFNDYIVAMSYNLGKFIYMADAVIDYEKDIKNNRYNPLRYLDKNIDTKQLLEIYMGNCCKAFENLPLENDIYTMRNILYSGVWYMYNEKLKKDNTKNDN